MKKIEEFGTKDRKGKPRPFSGKFSARFDGDRVHVTRASLVKTRKKTNRG